MSTPSNPDRLRRVDLCVLLIVATTVCRFIISLQPVPGYMDAAYYYSTGIQLAEGNGFNEPFLWNYLDNPQLLPHPSHSYWYPLASIISAGGMLITGKSNFISARILFLLIAAIFPVITALLAYQLTSKRRITLIGGILAIFCGYYLPFIVTTDNYAVYMLIGAIYFLLLLKITLPRIFLLGLLAGLLNLARADGLLWLPLTFLAVFGVLKKQSQLPDLAPSRRPWMTFLLAGFLILGGYLSSYGFWMVRNLVVFNSMTPPGSSHVLWMTDYNQIFSFNPEGYTFQSLLSTGWRAILQARFSALWQNLGTAIFAQGMIFLSPFILLGAWKNRRSPSVIIACTGWTMLLFAESFLFPFASVQGGFFHAGAVFQPMWFVLAPVGIEELGEIVTRRKSNQKMQWFFQTLLVMVAIFISGMLVKLRVMDAGWNEGEYRYIQVEKFLVEQEVPPDEVVMVVNPPAYNAMTGRRAIVLPTDGLEALLTAADQFDCDYLILEKDRLFGVFIDLYENTDNYPEFTVIGDSHDVRIVHIEP